MEKKDLPKMEYRNLGNSGLKVSVLSFGAMTFGDPTKEDEYLEILKRALDYGINFIDTAEAYPNSEKILGNLLKKLSIFRYLEKILLSVQKFLLGILVLKIQQRINLIILVISIFETLTGLSRKKVTESVKICLKNLQLDYVDVLFCHRFDDQAPLEEVCRGMSDMVDKGYALYWGTSTWDADMIMEAYWICDKLNLHKPIVEQPQYNMLVREKLEKEYANIFKKFKMGTTIYSPIAGGMLTGKYNVSIPTDSRSINPLFKMFFYDPYMSTEEKKQNTVKKLDQLAEIAKSLDATLPQLAIAWAIKNKDVSTAILGATKVSQIDENCKALEILPKLTSEVEEKIEKVLDNYPNCGMDSFTFTPKKSRRYTN